MKRKFTEVIKDKPLTLKIGLISVGVGCLLSFLVLFTVWLSLFLNNLSIKDFNSTTTVEISSGDTFVEEVIKNSKLGNKFGAEKSYKLAGPIKLSDGNIADIEAAGAISFYGKLYGYNYTISFDSNTELRAPLFSSLGEDALIERIAIENAQLKGKLGKPIAVITETNYGTIQDVSIDVSLQINSASEAAAFAVFNYGNINHCTANVHIGIESKYLTDDAGASKDWTCKFGAIASVNGEAKGIKGKIEDVIAAVDFPANFIVLSRQLNKNTNVGYIVGAWTDAAQITNASVLNGQFYLTAHDFADLFVNDKNTKTVKNRQKGEMTAGNHPGWAKWQFDETGNKLPILKPNLHD